uniref:CCHC-type domain-containing protein n=1 Tax=Megaselia scalaris TaxID=36166 RepID=T1GS77_MEGSC
KNQGERNAAVVTQELTQNAVTTKSNPFRDNAPSKTVQQPQAARTYICYNCDEPGHTSRYCRKPYRPSCRECRRKGVYTNECGCRKEEAPKSICAKCRRVGYTTDSCPCNFPGSASMISRPQANSSVVHQVGAIQVKEDPRPSKIVMIGQYSFWAILDTGATTSYFAINTAVQESTGFSPAELNFGRQLRTANSLYEELAINVQKEAINPSDQVNKIKELCQVAKNNLEQASRNQARWYNLRHRDWSPEVNEIVYKKNHYLSNAANNFCAKLAPTYSGPYVVKNYISPTVVEVKEVENPRKVHRVHLKDLKQVDRSRKQ